jgi:uncharacterized membrane protein YidH (DUF202 family)
VHSQRISWIYSGAVLVGIVLVIGGAVIAVLGLGNPTSVSIEARGLTVKTTSVGLAIMLIGVLLTAILLARKPEGVTLADRFPSPRRDRAIRFAVALFVVGVALLVVSLATE